MGNPTNPNRVVRVRNLDRFKSKTDALYATKAGLERVEDAIGIDTGAFVDLGLPSGTLWAKCNIGATEETDYGNYYMYGKGDRQYNASDSVYTGTEDPLASDKDTATVVLGAHWHMPTKEQFEELYENTTYEWTTINGVNGGKFTATNGNYVFFPAAGFCSNGSRYDVGSDGNYWSSTPNDSSNAYYLFFLSGDELVYSGSRNNGYSIRPVCETAPMNKVSNKADKDHNHDEDYSPLGHTHDERYYTETETDNKLSTKSNISHNHDTKYATKEELNNAVVGALVNDGFMFAVDRTTMKLHAYSANSFALNFTMQNGYLVATSATE